MEALVRWQHPERAEGVETEQQALFLRDHGCDEVQGFLYGTPMPPLEIAGFLRKIGIPTADSHRVESHRA